MIVADKHVVRFHYKLKDDSGEELESSEKTNPVAYLHGYNNIVSGLEKALHGKTAGDAFTVTLQPEEAYGTYRNDAVQRIPVKYLRGAKKWQPGMFATIQTQDGLRQVRILKAGKFMASVDSNHPLAGKELTFDVEVIDVRAATADELQHGHAHGEGGHQHN